MARLGILRADGQPWYGPFQTPPQPPDPGDPDPTDPPDPDPGNPDPGTPTVITHGRQVTTANTGFAGLGYTAGQLQASGSISTSAHGQVVQLKKVTGNIRVQHNNVTIRACEIDSPLSSHCIVFADGVYGTRIEFCRIHQSLSQGGNSNGVSGIYHVPAGRDPNVVHRCHISHVADGAKLSGGWIFQQNYWNPVIKYGSTHNDGVQSQKSTAAHDPSVIVRDNNFEGGANFGNALVFFTGESGSQYNFRIERNRLAAGPNTVGIALHGQDNIGSWLGTAYIIDNDFVTGYNGGPEGYISLNTYNGGLVKSGNRRVDPAGNFLGVLN